MNKRLYLNYLLDNSDSARELKSACFKGLESHCFKGISLLIKCNMSICM